MISPVLIVIAALVAAAALVLAGVFARWPSRPLAGGAAATFAFVVAWRLTSNALSLNEDFMPAVSVGDVVCLAAGGLPPAAMSAALPQLPRKGLVILVGALAAFVANVVIL